MFSSRYCFIVAGIVLRAAGMLAALSTCVVTVRPPTEEPEPSKHDRIVPGDRREHDRRRTP